MKKIKAKKITGAVIEKGDKIEPIKTSLSVEALMAKAVEKDSSVETLEKILVMRRELKAEFAREQFDVAIANFQKDCPEIKKAKQVKDRSGRLLYAYAPIEAIVKQVKVILSENGLSYSIKTEVNGKVKSICTIHHIAGHSESSEMEVPLGQGTNIMSESQVVAAAATFSKRYAFCNALGIMTGDEDSEENLKATGDEVEEAKAKLEKCLTEKQLLVAWKGFSKELRADSNLIHKAREIKLFIKNEENKK